MVSTESRDRMRSPPCLPLLSSMAPKARKSSTVDTSPAAALPPSEVRTGDAPPIPLAVRFQHERALARANQHPNPAHAVIPPEDSLVSSNVTSTIRHTSRRVLAARVEPASPGVLALGQERDQADETQVAEQQRGHERSTPEQALGD